MYNYKFPIINAIQVLMHIEAFDIIILNMSPDGLGNYLVSLDNPITSEQAEHLRESYNFEEVT